LGRKGRAKNTNGDSFAAVFTAAQNKIAARCPPEIMDGCLYAWGKEFDFENYLQIKKMETEMNLLWLDGNLEGFEVATDRWVAALLTLIKNRQQALEG
jgi:hypothetical protein